MRRKAGFHQQPFVEYDCCVRKQGYGRGGKRFSFEPKEKQKTFFLRRKSSNIKLKQKCTHRFRAGWRSRPCCAQSAQRKTAGQTEK